MEGRALVPYDRIVYIRGSKAKEGRKEQSEKLLKGKLTGRLGIYMNDVYVSRSRLSSLSALLRRQPSCFLHHHYGIHPKHQSNQFHPPAILSSLEQMGGYRF